jgi:hypothetical protein
MARPRKSKIDKQSVVVALRLTQADKKRFDAAALRAGLPVATMARIYTLQVIEALHWGRRVVAKRESRKVRRSAEVSRGTLE